MKIQIKHSIVGAGLVVAVGTAVAGVQEGYIDGIASLGNGDTRLYVSGEGSERPDCVTQEDSWILLAEDASMREMALQVGFDGQYVVVDGTGECRGGREIVKSVIRWHE
jgi:hypothetical protein